MTKPLSPHSQILNGKARAFIYESTKKWAEILQIDQIYEETKKVSQMMSQRGVGTESKVAESKGGVVGNSNDKGRISEKVSPPGHGLYAVIAIGMISAALVSVGSWYLKHHHQTTLSSLFPSHNLWFFSVDSQRKDLNFIVIPVVSLL